MFLEDTVRWAISSVMGDKFVKSDEKKELIYLEATNLFGHSKSQPLPFDEIETWPGHLDFYMNKFKKILNTPDDSDVGNFLDVDLRYLKTKKKNFELVLKKKVIHKDKYKDMYIYIYV